MPKHPNHDDGSTLVAAINAYEAAIERTVSQAPKLTTETSRQVRGLLAVTK